MKCIVWINMKLCVLNIIHVISSIVNWSALVIVLYCKKLARHYFLGIICRSR